MVKLGADPLQMEQLADTFDREARSLRNRVLTINYLLRATFWLGGRSEQFNAAWQQRDRRAMEHAAEQLAELARRIRAQASQQIQTSSDSPTESELHATISSRPRIESIETYDVSTTTHLLFEEQESSMRIVDQTMSDGSHRVIAEISYAMLIGFGLSDALPLWAGEAIKRLDLDTGFEVGATTGHLVEFRADTEADARRLREMLEGDASSIGNRIPFAHGYDSADLSDEELTGATGISIVSMTQEDIGVRLGAEWETAKIFVQRHPVTSHLAAGLPTSLEGHWAHSTTSDFESCLIVARTELGAELGKISSDSSPTTKTYELYHDADGDVSHFIVKQDRVSVRDVRSGGEKFRDFIIPAYETEELEVSTRVTSFIFSAEDIRSVPGAERLLDEAKTLPGARIGLGELLLENKEIAAGESYRIEGEQNGRTFGGSLFGVGYETGSASGSADVTSYEFTENVGSESSGGLRDLIGGNVSRVFDDLQ